MLATRSNPARHGLHTQQAAMLLCTLAACCLGSFASARDAVTYTLTHIATPPPQEGDNIDPFLISDLNNTGEVLGARVGPDGTQHAFIWKDGVFHDLNRFVASDIALIDPRAFSDCPDVVGTYEGSDFSDRPFFLSSHHRIIPLAGLTGDRITPVDVNNRKEVLFETLSSSADTHAIIWRHGQVTVLPDLPGEGRMNALAINNKGVALGYHTSPSFLFTPVLWQDGTVMPLSRPEGSDGALPVAFTDGNVVALWAVFRDEFPGREQAYLWHDGTITMLLPPRPELNRTRPNDINDEGVVTGVSYSLVAPAVPTIWRSRRGQDINTLICPTDPLARFVRIDAVGLINERGQILAHGLDSRQPDHLGSWYLLTPKVRHQHAQ